MPRDAPAHSKPSIPISASGLPVLGNWTGAGSVRGAGAAAGLAAGARGAGGAGAGALAATCLGLGAGALPLITLPVVISTLGSSVIWTADTVMPFLKSNTDAGLPLMVNWIGSDSLILYCLFSPFEWVRMVTQLFFCNLTESDLKQDSPVG